MSRSRRPGSARPKLLVIWSQRLAGDALRSALRLNGFDVADQSHDEMDDFEFVGEYRPDLIIVDIDSPNEVWNSEVIPLLEAFPNLKILAVTGRSDPSASMTAGHAGLQGCLRKDDALSGVIESLKAVMKGQRVFASAGTPQRKPGVHPATGEGRRAAPLAMHITPRERAILELLTEGASTDDIAARLSISRNTVRTFLNFIFAKLQVHTRYQAVAAAVRYGVVRPSVPRSRIPHDEQL